MAQWYCLPGIILWKLEIQPCCVATSGNHVLFLKGQQDRYYSIYTSTITDNAQGLF